MTLARYSLASSLALLVVAAGACRSLPKNVETDPAARTQAAPREEWEDKITENSQQLRDEGKKIFRWDTFGSEAFWGDQLRLHQAIVGEKKGGVGPGLTPRQALQLGLKADVGAVPKLLVEVLKEGGVSLDNPETTLELLRAGAVVGVKAVLDDKNNVTSIGITCALCHSTVDDSFVKGIGRRLDGWPNRDLNVGAIVALAPNLQPFEKLLGADTAKVKAVLNSWGPGKYDAELNFDGKAMRPDGKSGATMLPAAFGLAGQNLHTYGGWGSIPYWNAYVANTQMHGQGTFVDRRLGVEQFPLTSKTGFANKRDTPDKVTSKLAALHYYQLSIPAPKPPRGSYDESAATRGQGIFDGKAKCAGCHVPPLFSEPGWPMHTAEEIGIDDFQSSRSPDKMYRTTPLAGLFTRAKGGFYHDGRFADLNAVVTHYQGVLQLSLTDDERRDLVEYLKSL
ncbi:MAG TPA: hypothetical protein VJT80_11785 [Steroidobacteraceae bacterium]|nr:hypothetical protein [Steroidobacteraceae bacterium]